jgi:hypothetical protein
MNLEALRDLLFWCTLIDLALLLWWFGWLALAPDRVFRLHSRWFPISREVFYAVHYAGMALFKIGIILLNLVPYLALSIVV